MVIEAESQSEEQARTEQILHGNIEHASASREKYEKHHEQQLDEYGGETNQPEESEICRNNGQNQKRRGPSKHAKTQ